MDGLDAEVGIPLSKIPLKVEQIEQVTVGVYLGRRTDKNGSNKDLRTLMIHGVMVRTMEPFDWRQQVRSLWPDATEVHEGNRTFFKVKYPKLGPEPCFYVPDNRTLVCDEASVIRRIIRHTAPSATGFAHGDDWKKVEHDLIAVVLNNHNDRMRNATRRSDELDRDDFFARAMATTDRSIFGLANSDQFLFRVAAACHDSASAKSIANLVTIMCRETIDDMQKPHKDAIPDDLRMRELAIQLLKGVRVTSGGSFVYIESSLGVKLAELLPFIAKYGL